MGAGLPSASPGAIRLRDYRAGDEDTAITLWRESWQLAYPEIDFTARENWWRERWRNELVPAADVIVALQDGQMAGFVTIDAKGYLDQLVVAPQRWGSPVAAQLMDEAKRRSPAGITLLVNSDNVRAIRFYEKQGFALDGDDVNPVSGRPVKRMRWDGTKL